MKMHMVDAIGGRPLPLGLQRVLHTAAAENDWQHTSWLSQDQIRVLLGSFSKRPIRRCLLVHLETRKLVLYNVAPILHDVRGLRSMLGRWRRVPAPSSILSDETLLSLQEHQPQDVISLSRVVGLQDETCERLRCYGPYLLSFFSGVPPELWRGPIEDFRQSEEGRRWQGGGQQRGATGWEECGGMAVPEKKEGKWIRFRRNGQSSIDDTDLATRPASSRFT